MWRGIDIFQTQMNQQKSLVMFVSQIRLMDCHLDVSCGVKTRYEGSLNQLKILSSLQYVFSTKPRK